MTRVEIVDGRLEIEILGWHKLWAFRSHLSFPLEHLVSAERWNREKHRLDWRTIGAPRTAIPWVIVAGIFHNRGRHYFYDVCRFSRTIVIDLRDEWYTRVVVEVEDPDAVLRMITECVPSDPSLESAIHGFQMLDRMEVSDESQRRP